MSNVWYYADHGRQIGPLTLPERWGGDGRRTVEQTRVIDIGTIRRAGFVGKPARNWWKWRDKAYDAGIRPTYWNRGLIELPQPSSSHGGSLMALRWPAILFYL